MLYIPVETDYTTPVSLKRSLSDPEIYFPSSVRHSLIVAVNGILPHEKLSGASSSPLRVTGEGPGTPLGGYSQLSSCGPETGAVPRTSIRSERLSRNSAGETTLQIDINVIQPTPNISPSHSLRSISGDSKDLEAGAMNAESFAGIPFLIVPPSPVRIRRVSFSDSSIDNAEEEEIIGLTEAAPEISVTEVVMEDEAETSVTSSTARRRSRCVRQASLQVRSKFLNRIFLTHCQSSSGGVLQFLFKLSSQQAIHILTRT